MSHREFEEKHLGYDTRDGTAERGAIKLPVTYDRETDDIRDATGRLVCETWDYAGQQIADALNATDTLRPLLLNLLAVIHRDGGHYTEQHGLEKSCADAERLSAERLEQNDDTLRELVEAVKPVAVCKFDPAIGSCISVNASRAKKSLEPIDLCDGCTAQAALAKFEAASSEEVG
jgi:hypothetical protein